MSNPEPSDHPAEDRQQALTQIGEQFGEMLTTAFELGLNDDAVAPLLDAWRSRVRTALADQGAACKA